MVKFNPGLSEILSTIFLLPVWKTSVEFRGFPWKILHGIPWRIRTSISMEFHGNFSVELHRKYLHGGLGHFPWNSREIIMAPISMEISASIFSMEFHGKVPCNSIETTPSIIPWISREFHGIHRNYTFKISSESNGIHNRFWSTAIYLINKRTA